MMKTLRKFTLLLIGVLLFITSCAPSPKEEEEVIQTEDEQVDKEVSIVPSFQISGADYKMILPFRPSKARGVIIGQVGNRLDIEEMEDGLRRHSTDFFDTKEYFFEEGQYLSSSTVYDWLGRYLTEGQLEKEVEKEIARRKEERLNINEDTIQKNLQLGLNPALSDKDQKDQKKQRANPRYLSHVLEQNFLKKNKDDSVELAGVSIGLALKSVYRYQTEDGGPDFYHDIPLDEMLKEGEEIAQTVLERLRKIDDISGVPIMIALYREEDDASPVPGNFVAKTTVSGNDMLIGEWERTNEEYVLFPSDYAKKEYFDDYEIVKSFGEEIAAYFPNYVGYIGEGFYLNEELQKLSIEVPIEFFGGAEVVGFTQYIYGIVKSMFPNRYNLEVKIKSSEKLESVIYWNAGEEDPTVHVFH